MTGREQFLVLAALALAALGGTGLLYTLQDNLFGAYFGSLHPLLAVALVTALGFILFGFLHTDDRFKIVRIETFQNGLALAATFATLFAIPVIVIDLAFGYPRDINVPLPHALLFYPIMGYVAEIVFHAFPLALFLFALGKILGDVRTNGLLWFCILLSSTIEPIFQLNFALAEHSLSPVDVCTFLQVFAISLVQMCMFRRFDFMTALFFRMVYYLHWHILWGYLRLELLF